MIWDGLCVAVSSHEGSTTWSTPLRISWEISSKYAGAGLPEKFAEVETIGLRNLPMSLVQKSLMGTLIPTLPSSATTFLASPMAPG